MRKRAHMCTEVRYVSCVLYVSQLSGHVCIEERIVCLRGFECVCACVCLCLCLCVDVCRGPGYIVPCGLF